MDFGTGEIDGRRGVVGLRAENGRSGEFLARRLCFLDFVFCVCLLGHFDECLMKTKESCPSIKISSGGGRGVRRSQEGSVEEGQGGEDWVRVGLVLERG